MAGKPEFDAPSTTLGGCCGGVAPVLRRPIASIRGINDPRTARKALGLSLAGMGRALATVHPNGHGGRGYSRFAVSHWENGDYRPTAETREAYRRLIAGAVESATGGRVVVKARMGARVWRLAPLAHCAKCGKPFELQRSRDARCKRCRPRSE